MRKSKKLVLLATLLVTLNGGILLTVTWDEFNFSNSYYDDPLTPPNPVVIFIAGLEYSFDTYYNRSPSAPIVKIDLVIKIVGIFVADKSFSDFFVITWFPYSEGTTFGISMRIFWDVLENLSLFKKEIDITIILRPDTIYEIEFS